MISTNATMRSSESSSTRTPRKPSPNRSRPSRRRLPDKITLLCVTRSQLHSPPRPTTSANFKRKTCTVPSSESTIRRSLRRRRRKRRR
ncbi:hypothetical protein L5515_007542 [Caenorhabditis briggsae]|uniref:Uncharacterized protein n=1 Tax=Caenorhabditis briggsae TaxID=6238 RepID=A0AAE9F7F6_CAEBR|nr:hypothetical protein L5515_007542 [Caenorhabditis briggsae]